MTTYRPIAETDIEILVKMMQDFYAIDNYPIDPEKSKKLFSEFIANENLGKAWIIESDSKTVGYMILTFVFNFEYGGKIGFVDELYIVEAFRGKGIGAESIDFITKIASEEKLKLLYLEVEPHNKNARKLYLDKGFIGHKRQLLRRKLNNE
ncbi:GNAT family N-acetyltransferase [Flavobacterium sp.]|uniref:GNAT family N-acetyltransferase n=1 Tax=Flavobacterium sp. TaxID=239 RepID=UPI0011FABAE3|nr:GNAT family N-acetyltransferase [Flavobacterium sp.]RZJ71379.1 MAG: GNAT family N-acetyltransferase [Flavobacterium sp.]